MAEVIIRPLEAADLPQWQALESEAFDDPWSESQLKTWLQRPRIVALGAFAPGDDSMLGFCLYSYILDEAELLQIAVARQARGCGLATRLMQVAAEQLQALEVSRVMLEVRQSNSAARHCYQRFGYSEDGVRKGYYKTPQGREDALLMSYSLSP